MSTSGLKRFRDHNVANERTGTIDEVANDVQVEDAQDKNLLIYKADTRLWNNGTLEDAGAYSTGETIMNFQCAFWVVPIVPTTIRWYKNGNQVTLCIPEIIQATTPLTVPTYIFVAALPPALVPQKIAPTNSIKTHNQGADTEGCVVMGASMRIFNGGPGGNFTSVAGAWCGFYAFSITYVTASALVPSDPELPAVDPVIVASVAYTTAASLVRVNPGLSGIEEVDCQVTIPGANQFKLTSGTTDLTVTADCDVNQNLSSTSGVTFASLTLGATTLVSSTLDEDNMASNSATALATQQSIKAYVDGKIGGSVAASTNNILARYDGTNGIKGSTLTIGDTGTISGLVSINLINTSVDKRLPRYSSTNGIQGSGITVSDLDVLSGVMGLNLIGASADNRLTRYDATSAVQGSGITVSDADALTGVTAINLISTSLDHRLPRYDGTSAIQGSGIEVSDANNIIGVNELRTNTVLANYIDEYTVGAGVELSGILMKTSFIDEQPTTGFLDIQCDSVHSIYMNTNASGSIRIGKSALSTIAYGAETAMSIAIGEEALKSLTTGGSSIAIGYRALASETTELANLAIGNLAGENATGRRNVILGDYSGRAAGIGCTCLGFTAQTAARDYCITIGYGAEASANYYVQIGEPGLASNSAKGYFYSQLFMDEGWRDTNTRLASIDGTGNFVKTTVAVPTGGTHTTQWSGIWAAAQNANDIQYKVTNGVVHLLLPTVTATANTAASIVNDTALPAAIRPAVQQRIGPIYCNNAGNHVDGIGFISTSGVITVYVANGSDQYGNFTNSGNGGILYRSTITYML